MLPAGEGLFDDFLIPMHAEGPFNFHSLIDNMCEDLFSDNMPLFSDLPDDIDFDQSNKWVESPTVEAPPVDYSCDSEFIDVTKYLLQDCMWPVARQPVSQNSPPQVRIKIEPGLEAPEVTPAVPLNINMQEEESEMMFLIKNCTPYTIDNDHCYYKSKPEEEEEEGYSTEVADSDEASLKDESDESTDSDDSMGEDEIDIVTVPPEDRYGVCHSIKLQRALSLALLQAENVPPTPPVTNSSRRNSPRSNAGRKPKGCLGPRETAAVKAKLAKARKLQQSGKCIARTTNRGRRPANSLNSSSGNSHSNSDNEEPMKRSMHNCMERMRRQQQRSALYGLREQIPDLKNDFKASKVKIIQVGTAYINHITCVNENLLEHRKRLEDKNLALRKKLELCRSRFYY